MTIMHVYVVL